LIQVVVLTGLVEHQAVDSAENKPVPPIEKTHSDYGVLFVS
jgi:hypothetical protein